MSEEQASRRHSGRALVARYERIRSQKVDPREDNALAITTDGRKLALDARMISLRRGAGLPRLEDQRTWRKTSSRIWEWSRLTETRDPDGLL